MLVFLSPSWDRKPSWGGLEGEAQAGVRATSHEAAHDQMKKWYLFWHHKGKGRASAQRNVRVNGTEQECR